MKKLTLSAMLIFLMLTAVSCSKTEKSDLKFYVISRDMLSDSMSDSETVAAAVSDGRLAFDGDDIEGYNWQTHTVMLKEESVPSLGIISAESGGSAVFKTDDTYAFVLALNSELIYVGGFSNGIKNPAVPLQPSIEDNGRYSFKITYNAKYATSADPRSNVKLYNFLNGNGMLSSKSE